MEYWKNEKSIFCWRNWLIRYLNRPKKLCFRCYDDLTSISLAYLKYLVPRNYVKDTFSYRLSLSRLTFHVHFKLRPLLLSTSTFQLHFTFHSLRSPSTFYVHIIRFLLRYNFTIYVHFTLLLSTFTFISHALEHGPCIWSILITTSHLLRIQYASSLRLTFNLLYELSYYIWIYLTLQ